MALQRVTERTRVTRHDPRIVYEYDWENGDKMMRGCMYSFAADESGRLLMDEYFSQSTIESLRMVMLDQPQQWIYRGIEDWGNSYWEYATYRCVCGTVFAIDGDTNCPCCHRLYNAFGQEIKYRHDDRAAYEAEGGFLAAGEHFDEEDY